MPLLLCLIALAGSVLIGTRQPRRLAARRSGEDVEAAKPATPLVEDSARRLVVCMLAGAVLGWTLFELPGVMSGALCGGAASWWLGRLEPPSVTRTREEVQRSLPLAVDLLAACAEVGLPPDRALLVVGRAVAGPLGDRLAAISARLALGVDPVSEWRAMARDHELAPLARAVARSLESGAPLAACLARLSIDRRREQRTVGQIRARRVGVLAAGPLGLCFLPSFILVGVVPTVVGSFSNLVLG